MTHPTTFRLVAGALALFCATAARAQTPLADQMLDDQRGGYLTAAGLSFDFGAVISTVVDDKLALQTRLSLTDAGLVTSQIAPGADGQTGTAGPVSTMPLPIAGNDGTTRVLHVVTPGQLAGVVLNTASNRSIRQDTALTLQVPGLDALQTQIGLQRLGAQLHQAAATASLGH